MAQARPAVVAIEVKAKNPGPASLPFSYDSKRMYPELPPARHIRGLGSGFVIRKDGYIVTNHHVVAQAESLRVKLPSLHLDLAARVVGLDPRSDLALLKVESPVDLPVLPLGSSADFPIGSWVMAIGNPYGLVAIASKGIVSGKGRTAGDLSPFRTRFFDFIQTDAAIDLGNSGGPLLNMRGEVIGINTAVNSRARGIGFAIPVDLAKAVLPHLLADGRLKRSYLGIRIDPVPWQRATALGPGEA